MTFLKHHDDFLLSMPIFVSLGSLGQSLKTVFRVKSNHLQTTLQLSPRHKNPRSGTNACFETERNERFEAPMLSTTAVFFSFWSFQSLTRAYHPRFIGVWDTSCRRKWSWRKVGAAPAAANWQQLAREMRWFQRNVWETHQCPLHPIFRSLEGLHTIRDNHTWCWLF